jgi:hypothetical protein
MGLMWRHVAEPISPIDRPLSVFYQCSVHFLRSSLIVYELLAKFYALIFHCKSFCLSHFCTGGLLTFFVYLYPLKSYSTFFVWLENPLWG